jgi:hypothetical protein
LEKGEKKAGRERTESLKSNNLSVKSGTEIPIVARKKARVKMLKATIYALETSTENVNGPLTLWSMFVKLLSKLKNEYGGITLREVL